MDRSQQAELKILIVDTDGCLERAYQIADDIFGRVMQKRGKTSRPRQARPQFLNEALDHHAMLRNRKRVRASGLAVPARNPGKAMGDIFDFHVERRRIEEIEPAPAEHALPRASVFCRWGRHGYLEIKELANVSVLQSHGVWSLQIKKTRTLRRSG
jgi:hypothetical protein